MSEVPLPEEHPVEKDPSEVLRVIEGPGEQTEAEEASAPSTPREQKVVYGPVEQGPLPRIAVLGEVELRVDVVLGRARRTLLDLLGVRPGHTLELDRQRNSPVEVLVNNKPFALGEIVVIDETNLGVRVLEILDWNANPTQRAS